MLRTRRILRLTAAAGLAAAGIGLSGGSAQAGLSHVCGVGDICLYKHYDLNDGYSDNKCITNELAWTDPDVSGNTWLDCDNGSTTSDGMDNDLSSLRHRGSGYTFHVYEHDDYLGDSSSFGVGIDGHLGANAIGDNRMSSFSTSV